MKVTDALRGVDKIFLDSAPVIYFVERNPYYSARVDEIFDQIDAGNLLASTSVVTLAECLIHPVRAGNVAAESAFLNILVGGPEIHFLSLDQNHAHQAAKIRAKYNLLLPDALQIGAAILSQCDAFLTNDLSLKKVTEIPILVLDELEI